LSKILSLESRGADTYIGESPHYEWGRIYGGLAIAQALKAAALTVRPEHKVHSLHAYFILGGDFSEPVRYEVDRLRNGRSFSTRQVVARQSSGAILNLSASFQKDEEGPDIQTWKLDDGPLPEDLEDAHVIPGREMRTASFERDPPRSREWARFSEELGDDPIDHVCAIAYLSDSNAMRAIRASHPKYPGDQHYSKDFMLASLDHSVWFHRPARADQWLMFDMQSQGLIGPRGIAIGHVMGRDGRHIATIAQEGLLRERKT
jgi:acyl-CoA thioesterase-2